MQFSMHRNSQQMSVLDTFLIESDCSSGDVALNLHRMLRFTYQMSSQTWNLKLLTLAQFSIHYNSGSRDRGLWRVTVLRRSGTQFIRDAEVHIRQCHVLGGLIIQLSIPEIL